MIVGGACWLNDIFCSLLRCFLAPALRDLRFFLFLSREAVSAR